MDYYIGLILLFPYTFVPYGWHSCDGATIPIVQNTALYSLIGTKFGGDGKNTFALPNLTNYSPNPNMLYCICMNGIYPSRQ